MIHNRFCVVIALLTGMIAGTAMESGRPVAAGQAEGGKASIQERLARVSADLFSRADRVDQDITELKGILALDPRSTEGHFLLGIAYRLLRSAEFMGEAVAELRQALTLDPDLVPARFYLAHVYLDLGRPGRARDELQTALVKAPRNPQLLALLGEAERQGGNPRRALEVTRQALQADESFAQARYYLGLALLDLGQRAEAIRELERVVQSGANNVEAYLGLGTAYLDAGRLDEALQSLTQATQIDPSRLDIRIRLARAYRSKGLLDKADEQLKLTAPGATSSLISPLYQYQQVESDHYLELGLVRLQQGKLEAAAGAFEKVLDMDADHGPAHRYLAEVYLLQGSYARAFEHAARAEKLGAPLPEEKRKLLQEKLRGKDKKDKKEPQ